MRTTFTVSRDSLPRLDHVYEGTKCWCTPKILTVCACSGAGCADCAGTGTREVAPELLDALPPGRLIVVHRGEALIVQ